MADKTVHLPITDADDPVAAYLRDQQRRIAATVRRQRELRAELANERREAGLSDDGYRTDRKPWEFGPDDPAH